MLRSSTERWASARRSKSAISGWAARLPKRNQSSKQIKFALPAGMRDGLASRQTLPAAALRRTRTTLSDAAHHARKRLACGSWLFGRACLKHLPERAAAEALKQR